MNDSRSFAVLKHARISSQKVNLVASRIRGLSANKALNILSFTVKKAAFILRKVLKSAVANAEHNNGLDIDELIISKIHVNQAPSLKRFKPRAKGRMNRIVKRNSHILIEVKIKC